MKNKLQILISVIAVALVASVYAGPTANEIVSPQEAEMQAAMKSICPYTGYPARQCEDVVRAVALRTLQRQNSGVQPYVSTILYDANARTDAASVLVNQEWTSAARCQDHLETVLKVMVGRPVRIATCKPK